MTITYSSKLESCNKDELVRDIQASDKIVAAFSSGERSTLWTRGTLPTPFRTLCIHVADDDELQHVESIVAEVKYAPAPPDQQLMQCSLERLEHLIAEAQAVGIKFKNRPISDPGLRIYTRNPGVQCPELIIPVRSESEFLTVCSIVHRQHILPHK